METGVIKTGHGSKTGIEPEITISNAHAAPYSNFFFFFSVFVGRMENPEKVAVWLYGAHNVSVLQTHVWCATDQTLKIQLGLH